MPRRGRPRKTVEEELTAAINQSRENALLVGLHLTSRGAQRPPSGPAPDSIAGDDSLEELKALAATAGAQTAEAIVQSRPRPDAATLVGSGKGDELKAKVQ